jgi:hypothetical protein
MRLNIEGAMQACNDFYVSLNQRRVEKPTGSVTTSKNGREAYSERQALLIKRGRGLMGCEDAKDDDSSAK